jgi:hypothetical protein
MTTNALHDILATALTGAILFLIQQAFSFLRTKTSAVKNDSLRNALYTAESEAERLTHTIVASLNQTVVDVLKSTNGNKLTPEDAVRIKDQAITKIFTLMSDESMSILLNHKGDLQEYLGYLIEEVVSNKKFGKITTATTIESVSTVTASDVLEKLKPVDDVGNGLSV